MYLSSTRYNYSTLTLDLISYNFRLLFKLKTMNKYIIGLILLLGLLSCEEQSEMKIDNYVVNSFFSDNQPFIIKTSNTVSVFDTARYSSVKGFEGKLYEDGEPVGDFTFQDAYIRDGIPSEIPEGYTVKDFTMKQGKEYRFELKRGNEVISGSDIIPEVVPFTLTEIGEVDDEYDIDYKGIQYTLNFKDKPDEENFYVVAYNLTEFHDENDELGWTQAGGWMQTDDPAIEFDYYHQGIMHGGGRFIFSDNYFDGREYSLPISFFVGHRGERRKRLNIYLLSVSRQYYLYVTTSLKQLKNNEDYYAEPTTVYNNIENGFGIFAGFSSHQQAVQFPK